MLGRNVNAALPATQAAAHLRQQRARFTEVPVHEEIESFPVYVVGLGQSRFLRCTTCTNLPDLGCRLPALEDEVPQRPGHKGLMQVVCLLQALVGNQTGCAKVGVDALQPRSHIHAVAQHAILDTSLRPNVANQDLPRVNAAAHADPKALHALKDICRGFCGMLLVVHHLIRGIEDGEDLVRDELKQRPTEALDRTRNLPMDGAQEVQHGLRVEAPAHVPEAINVTEKYAHLILVEAHRCLHSRSVQRFEQVRWHVLGPRAQCSTHRCK
mmetsp:Transcript_49176/g.115615  ORF Transcript_49176/g.115615 Transcript_49176/m.115615 type:complete len:269 (-) Transcript_49176:2089-2895(-)